MKKTVILLIFITAGFLSAQNYYRNWTVVNKNAKKNIALIIANDFYESGGSLGNPVKTAKKVRQTLVKTDFDVLEGYDLNREQTLDIIKTFTVKAKSYNFAMLFYLGHGFQIDGNNYLIPVDANPASKTDVEVEAINLNYIFRKLNRLDIPKVIVLDACRDNPFKKNWTSRDRAISMDGFADITAPINAEILFTTQKDSQVKDDNPYLNYFMDEMIKGGCLDDIVRNVSKRIFEYDSKQIPAKYGQLFEEVCFDKPKPLTNEEKINQWYSEAAAFYKSGRYDKAREFFQKAAEAGHSLSQVELGSLYRLGKGTEKDFKKAYEWYRKAFKAKYSLGYYYLALMYEKGLYISKDEEFARRLLKSSASRGHARSQNKLGLFFHNGKGGEKNEKQAFYWFMKAAKQGLDIAQYNLGYFYEKGYGIEKNQSKARSWYQKACDQKYKKACDKLKN